MPLTCKLNRFVPPLVMLPVKVCPAEPSPTVNCAVAVPPLFTMAPPPLR